MRCCILVMTAMCWSSAPGRLDAADRPSWDEAARALRKAVRFFRTDVSAEGGYLWRYSADLARREGEGRTGRRTAWIQPPGTPTVGQAYLEAYERTGDEYYLDAARETAHALVRGQLKSGGWDNRIEFDPELRKKYAYRVDENPGSRNLSTLDDNKTQSALRLLMRVDRTLRFRDAKIHEAVRYALESLLRAQYPNGAWPQQYSEAPDPARHPVKEADYPESWPREWPKKDYRGYYTFNDNTLADAIDVMFEAAEIYGDDRYGKATRKAGDFILLAQMPDPQPAWAQQYDAEMHPAWARKFEPPAITGGESQGVLRVLLELYRRTGDRKYLAPVPRAVAYLRKSELPDGRLARFYELQTNRPLYFTKEYELVYRDDDLPTHYGFKVSSKLDAIETAYRRLVESGPRDAGRRRRPATHRMTPRLADEAKAVIEALDERGAWVEPGRLRFQAEDDKTEPVIATATFVENVDVLSRFLAASRPERSRPDGK